MDIHSKISSSALTDVGSVRKNNEDSIGAWPEMGLFVVADGMGGHKGGEMASGITIDVIHKHMKSSLESLNKTGELDEETGYTQESLILESALNLANETIRTTGESQPQYQNMGTTVVGLIFYDNRFTVAHVGDSRLYRIRENEIEQLTLDHSLIEDLIARGFYTPEEASKSLNKNVLLRALGAEEDVKIDVLEDFALVGDIYVNCSDGLTNMITDEQILKIVLDNQENLEQATKTLVNTANENGGKDNISVILAKVDKEFPSKVSWFKKLLSWFVK